MPDEQRNLTANFTANASGFARGSNEVIQHLRELNTEMSEVRNSIRNTNTQMRTYERQLEALRRETNNGENATEQQRREMRQLEDAIAQCNVELGQYQTTQQQLQREIRSTNRQLDEQGRTADDTSKKFSSFSTVLAGIGAAAGAGLTYALTKAQEMQQAVNSLTTATNAGAEEAAQYGNVIRQIYADNFGEDFTDIADSVSIVKRNLKELDETELTHITEGAYALLDVFGYDVGESSRAAKAMMQNFDISAAQAYDFITAGAQGGLDYAGDMLDSISEYSVQYAKMGLSAEDMFAIMARGAENGAWNIDKVGDAVKEMSIRVIDGSKSTKEGFDIIGMSADDMSAKFAQGGDVATQAFTDTLKAIKALDDPVKQDAAGVALLGTMWEDLGKDVVLSMADIENASFEAAGALDAVLKKNYSGTGSSAASLKREIELIITDLGTELLPLANEVIDDVKSEIPEITAGIKTMLSVGANLIKMLWEARSAVLGIVSGIASYKALTENSEHIERAIESIDRLIQRYRQAATATESATAAQRANNAVAAANPYGAIATALGLAVSAATAWYDALDDCNERMREFNSEAQTMVDKAAEYDEISNGLSKLSDKYKEIENSVESAAEKDKAFKELQQQLIEQYPDVASGINSTAGAYVNLKSAIDGAIASSKESARIQADQAVEAAKKAEQESTALQIGGVNTGITSFDERERTAAQTAMAALKELGVSEYGDMTFGGQMYLTGSYEQKIKALKTTYAYLSKNNYSDTYAASVIASTLSQLETANSTKLEAQAALDAIIGPKNIYHSTAEWEQAKGEAALREEEKRKAAAAELKEQQQSSADELQEEYKTEKQLADDMYSVKELADKEYYAKLTELRDNYLTQNTHEWYAATAELIKLSEQIGNAAEKTADKITASMEDVKDEYNDLMAAIDAELERREREKQDTELQSQIDAVSARLAYENVDEYSRIALEKELAELKAQQEDIAFERNATDSKAQIQAAYDATERLMNMVPAGYDPRAWEGFVNAAFAQISEGYMPNATAQDKRESQKVYNIVINAENMTTNQAVDAVKNAIASGAI